MARTEQPNRRIVRNKQHSQLRRQGEVWPRFADHVIKRRKPFALGEIEVGGRLHKIRAMLAQRDVFASFGFTTFGDQIEAACQVVWHLPSSAPDNMRRILISAMIDGTATMAIVTNGTVARDMRSHIGEALWSRDNQQVNNDVKVEGLVRIYHTTNEASHVERALRAEFREHAQRKRELAKVNDQTIAAPMFSMSSFMSASFSTSSTTQQP